MKTCFKCNLEKPLSEYYRHAQMADGYLNKCKECAKKDTQLNRALNSEYYKEYDRKRFKEDPKVKERHKKYRKTEAGKKSIKKSRNKWLEKNTIKRASHILVGSRLKDGTLQKPKRCECCGEEKKRLNGHHDDYTKPLDVRWLCCLCHVEWHRINGEGKY